MTKRQDEAWAQERPGRPRVGVITRRCGGRWNQTKALAQLPQNPAMNTHIWSEAEMLQALRQAATVLEDPVGETAYEAWRGSDYPSIETIRKHWGSLNAARIQVQLMTQEPGGAIWYTEADWQQALRDFIGMQITASQHEQWAQTPLQVLHKRAGGFWKALETIGLGHLTKSVMARIPNPSSRKRREEDA